MEIFKDFKSHNLTALKPAFSGRWFWACVCGKQVAYAPSRVLSGEYTDCGCQPKTCKCGNTGYYQPYRKTYSSTCRRCRSKQTLSSWRRNPKTLILNSARTRAKKAGIPFSITTKDFDIPEFCPVLGVPLVQGNRQEHDLSPSLDRIKPELGYVQGNVAIISHRANRIKADATLDELKKTIAWVEKQTY